MREQDRLRLLTQLQVLGEQIEERWPKMTNSQVHQLEEGVEGLWEVLTRRK